MGSPLYLACLKAYCQDTLRSAFSCDAAASLESVGARVHSEFLSCCRQGCRRLNGAPPWCCSRQHRLLVSRVVVMSEKEKPRPQNIRILFMGTPKKVPPILGKPYLCCVWVPISVRGAKLEEVPGTDLDARFLADGAALRRLCWLLF